MSQDSQPRPHTQHSILETIGQRTGRTPSVVLSDSDAEDAAPILDPRIEGIQSQLRSGDRVKYQVLGEIARGGMGVVLRGHDRELGRDVAMKVVHGELADRPDVLERFVEEAQVGGQLQHPGIVPVYELGLLQDERPYFTMKLIKGHTLAKLLTRRRSVEEDRVRFLTIFASVCQTMAYAHTKGVVHRDLKPANVMVGSFGEVQVVDWGLSKVLGSGGVDDEIRARDEAQSVVETVRSGPGSDSDSVAGNILGTPAYMAPEQARGEIDQLDERADVFALGAILCELLTGAPPYVAREDGPPLVRLAAKAELEDARARIAACSAADGLRDLCLECLAPARQARPASAEELAEGVQGHLSGLEVAAHEAQLAAAEQRVRAERSRRRFQMASLAAISMLLAGAGLWWTESQRRERHATLAGAVDDLHAEVRTLERSGEYRLALETARGGVLLVEAGEGSAVLQERVDRLVRSTQSALDMEEARLEEVRRVERFLEFLTDVEMRQVKTGIVQTDEAIDREYAAAFGDFGLGLDDPEVGERVQELRDTEIGIRVAMGADSWGRLVRRLDRNRQFDLEILTGIAMDLDTDEFRTDVRRALEEGETGRLVALAGGEGLGGEGPETLALLAYSLQTLGSLESARYVLVLGADLYPDSFLLNFAAGNALYQSRPNGPAEGFVRAEGYLRAALALRPDLAEVHTQLGNVQRAMGNTVQSVRSTIQAVSMAPEHTWNARILGFDLMVLSRHEEALEWFDVSQATDADMMVENCRLALGHITRDAYMDWVDAREVLDPGLVISMAFVLCTPDEEGRIYPQRARDLVESYLPDAPPVPYLWNALGIACLHLEDGAAALDAGRKAEELAPPSNMSERAQAILIQVGAHRLLGQDDLASACLTRARRLRDELITGAEQEWEESSLLETFRMIDDR